MKTTAKTPAKKTTDKTDNAPFELHSAAPDPDTAPDWDEPCELCGAVPTLPITAMCGPCTFGEAETAGGNW